MARWQVAVVVAVYVPACAFVYPMPAQPDPTSGEYECPVARPAELTASALTFAVSATALYYKSRHDGPVLPRYDMYGFPNCDAPLLPDCNPSSSDKAAAFSMATTAMVAAALATASWIQYDRCTKLDPATAATPTAHDVQEHQRSLAGMARAAILRAEAGDCHSAREIAERVRLLDATYYEGVLAPSLTSCQ